MIINLNENIHCEIVHFEFEAECISAENKVEIIV